MVRSQLNHFRELMHNVVRKKCMVVEWISVVALCMRLLLYSACLELYNMLTAACLDYSCAGQLLATAQKKLKCLNYLVKEHTVQYMLFTQQTVYSTVLRCSQDQAEASASPPRVPGNLITLTRELDVAAMYKEAHFDISLQESRLNSIKTVHSAPG